MHISENVDFDTPYSFFFFGFLSLCYVRGDAAGSTTLTRNRPRHLLLSKEVQSIAYTCWCIRIVWVTNSRNMSLMVAVLQDAFLLTSALGLTLGRKCESANKVLLIVHTSFSVILTWIMLRMIFKMLSVVSVLILRSLSSCDRSLFAFPLCGQD